MYLDYILRLLLFCFDLPCFPCLHLSLHNSYVYAEYVYCFCRISNLTTPSNPESITTTKKSFSFLNQTRLFVVDAVGLFALQRLLLKATKTRYYHQLTYALVN